MNVSRMVPLALCLAAFTTTTAMASSKHKIDIDMEACFETPMGQSQQGRTQILYETAQQWDGSLNEFYNRLRGLLHVGNRPDGARHLQDAQLAWIACRDLDFKFLNEFFASLHGSMYQTAYASSRMQVVRSRALFLEHSYRKLTDETSTMAHLGPGQSWDLADDLSTLDDEMATALGPLCERNDWEAVAACFTEYEELWDRKLNQVFAKLQERLIPARFELLRTAQIQWLKVRDADFEVADAMADQFRLGSLNRGYFRVHSARARVLLLARFLGIIEGNENDTFGMRH